MSAREEVEKLIPLLEELFHTDWSTICKYRKPEYAHTRFLIALYLFNLGFRHREISEAMDCHRTQLYKTMERATDIMKCQHDDYYRTVRKNLHVVFDKAGMDWNVLNKWL